MAAAGDRRSGEGRCPWAEGSDLMRHYHDTEWGVPSRDDRHLYEMLVLEGAQAGLSWSTILNKREGYREAFAGFDPEEVAAFGDGDVARLLGDPSIVRHRQKVASAIQNARAVLRVAGERGTFADYVWGWTDGVTIVHEPASVGELPATTELSDRVSRDLKQRGFSFVGPTIVYSFLQSVGVVDDHVVGCPWKRAAA